MSRFFKCGAVIAVCLLLGACGGSSTTDASTELVVIQEPVVDLNIPEPDLTQQIEVNLGSFFNEVETSTELAKRSVSLPYVRRVQADVDRVEEINLTYYGDNGVYGSIELERKDKQFITLPQGDFKYNIRLTDAVGTDMFYGDSQEDENVLMFDVQHNSYRQTELSIILPVDLLLADFNNNLPNSDDGNYVNTLITYEDGKTADGLAFYGDGDEFGVKLFQVYSWFVDFESASQQFFYDSNWNLLNLPVSVVITDANGQEQGFSLHTDVLSFATEVMTSVKAEVIDPTEIIINDPIVMLLKDGVTGTSVDGKTEVFDLYDLQEGQYFFVSATETAMDIYVSGHTASLVNGSFYHQGGKLSIEFVTNGGDFFFQLAEELVYTIPETPLVKEQVVLD